jgi:hypothetical protein
MGPGRRRLLRGAGALGVAAAVAGLALLATACGGGSGDSEVARIDSQGEETSTTGTTSTTPPEDPQEAAIAWARCMRERGIQVEDPKVDENGRLQLQIGPGAGSIDRTSPAFREAANACRPLLQNAIEPPTEEEQEALQDSLLQFARCMRQNGVNVPDPKFEGGGGGGLFQSVDPDDPDFQRAADECREHLRRPGGRAGSP